MPAQSPAAADFRADLETIQTLAKAPVTTAAELAATLGLIYKTINAADPARYDRAALKAAAPHLLFALFDIRTHLRDSVPGWQSRGFMTRDVQRTLRDALRILRYASDIIGEINIGHAIIEDGEAPMQAFIERTHNTLVPHKFETGKNLQFRAGDVLIVRGTRHNSAAIARIGDIDSQFSHVCIVHFDDRGTGFVVESLIEDGAVITPLKQALNHGMARAILLRHPDEALAARAAKSIFDHVTKSNSSSGRRIWYDFTMRLTNYNELFCSKLVRLAFDNATGGKLRLPTYTTLLDAKNKDFFKRVGVKAAETFAPGDLEIEPNLDLIAEWQDYRVTPRIRLQDLIMTKLFEWMDERGYKFEEDTTVKIVAFFGRQATKLWAPARDLVFSVVPKIPPNMSRRTIATIVMLHKTAEPLLQDLQHLDRLNIATEGASLHPTEVFAHLEKVREQSRGRIGYLVAPPGKI